MTASTKNYRDYLRYLYDTGTTYTQILKAAHTAEAEADNFKEVETSKSMKSADPTVLGELQALKAEVKKIWAQPPNQPPQKKSGDGPNHKKKEKNDGKCYRCGGTGHFVRECPSPAMDLNSQQGGKKKSKAPPSSCKEGGEYIHYGPEPQPRSPRKRGWARTGLEPEAWIRVNLRSIESY